MWNAIHLRKAYAYGFYKIQEGGRNWLLSPRLIFVSLLLQPVLSARISSLKSFHQWHGVLLIGSWTHSHMQKPSWNALTDLQSSLSCLACKRQHKDLSYIRTPKATLMRNMAMQRAMSYWSQFTSVEALYAEMDVGTPNATTRSFQDLVKSKVDT